jgi:hypothetical protein
MPTFDLKPTHKPVAAYYGALEEIFADVGRDKTRLDSARKTLAWLQENPDPRPFAGPRAG